MHPIKTKKISWVEPPDKKYIEGMEEEGGHDTG